MTLHCFQLAQCFICLALMTSVTRGERKNATYDPFKGTYMDSFQDPSGKLNCSVYFAYRTMFFIDGCNSSDPFIRGLNFTFSNISIPRVVYTPFGVLLEVAKIDWENYRDPLTLNITSDDYPIFYKNISIIDTIELYRYFESPTLRGIGNFNGQYTESADSNVLMNTKMLVIFYLEFENYYGCDAYFWVGKGKKPDKNGKKIPDENGSLMPLNNYYKKTIVLKLLQIVLNDPTSPEMTIYDIDYLGIYCPDTDYVYSYLTFNLRKGEYGEIDIHPPFIFDRFFLGEEMVLCLPNGTYSREINLDDTMSELPCLGGSSSLVANGLLSLITVVALVASVLVLNLES